MKTPRKNIANWQPTVFVHPQKPFCCLVLAVLCFVSCLVGLENPQTWFCALRARGTPAAEAGQAGQALARTARFLLVPLGHDPFRVLNSGGWQTLKRESNEKSRSGVVGVRDWLHSWDVREAPPVKPTWGRIITPQNEAGP